MRPYDHLVVGLSLCLLACSQAVEPAEAVTSDIDTQSHSATTTSVQEAAGHHEGMIEIPGGSFEFGVTEEYFQAFVRSGNINFPGMIEETRQGLVVPPQQVELGTFYLDEFEVTNESYLDFLKATDYRSDGSKDFLKSWTNGVPPDWAAMFPVVWISQEDAAAYCRWLGKRLPTEQEWEKAARSDDGRHFPWGNDRPERETTNFRTVQAEPFGNRPADRSPYGVYDLGGNVAELTATTVRVRGVDRVVVRGGSFKSGARETLVYYRNLAMSPEERAEHIGFRCAADPE
jgi:formylglycine-generating enzyme required for sulfatase activity